MKLTGVMVVRNAADTLGVVVRHHLVQGVDELLVVDNGSDDATPSLLDALSTGGYPVRWRSDPGPFLPAEMTPPLVREARAGGADWIIAIDADEFWLADGGLKRFLAGLPGEVESVAANVVNLVQWRFAPGGPLGLMGIVCRTSKPIDKREYDEALAGGRQYPWVARRFGRKVIVRADLDFRDGTAHSAVGNSAPPLRTNEVICLARAIQDRNHREGTIAGLSDDGDAVERIWRRNSWVLPASLGDVRAKVPLRLDLRLVRCVLPHLLSARSELRRTTSATALSLASP